MRDCNAKITFNPGNMAMDLSVLSRYLIPGRYSLLRIPMFYPIELINYSTI